jgi:hypothetical protein
MKQNLRVISELGRFATFTCLYMALMSSSLFPVEWEPD